MLIKDVGIVKGLSLFVAVMLGSYAWKQIEDGRDEYYNPFESRFGIYHEKIVGHSKDYEQGKAWDFKSVAMKEGISSDLYDEYEDWYVFMEHKGYSYTEGVAELTEGASVEEYNKFKNLRKEYYSNFEVEAMESADSTLNLKYKSNLAAWKQSMADHENLMMIYWGFSLVVVSMFHDFALTAITFESISKGIVLIGVFLIISPILFVVFPGFFHIQDDYLGPYYFKTCWNLWGIWAPVCMVSIISVLTTMGFYPQPKEK